MMPFLRDLLLVTSLILAILGLLVVVGGYFGYPSNRLALIALAFWLSETQAMFVSRYPRGEDYIMMRLGGAAFCRIVVPLLVIFGVAWYSNSFMDRQDVLPILVFYVSGLVLGVNLTLRELAASGEAMTTLDESTARETTEL